MRFEVSGNATQADLNQKADSDRQQLCSGLSVFSSHELPRARALSGHEFR
jgi:hypothetical protein